MVVKKFEEKLKWFICIKGMCFIFSLIGIIVMSLIGIRVYQGFTFTDYEDFGIYFILMALSILSGFFGGLCLRILFKRRRILIYSKYLYYYNYIFMIPPNKKIPLKEIDHIDLYKKSHFITIDYSINDEIKKPLNVDLFLSSEMDRLKEFLDEKEITYYEH